jgi:hypothetical protein
MVSAASAAIHGRNIGSFITPVSTTSANSPSNAVFIRGDGHEAGVTPRQLFLTDAGLRERPDKVPAGAVERGERKRTADDVSKSD